MVAAKAMRISTYFVKHNGPEAVHDLIVRAYTTQDVLRYWREFFELGDDQHPELVLRLPATPIIGAIPWHTIRTVYRDGG